MLFIVAFRETEVYCCPWEDHQWDVTYAGMLFLIQSRTRQSFNGESEEMTVRREHMILIYRWHPYMRRP